MIAAATAATGCIEDGFETSPSAQPAFSTDTLKLGEQFADEPSPTFAMKIYNRHGKQLNLQSVRMRSGKHFRINVDGMSGTAFANVEIRPNDSIYVFVETTLPSTGLIGPQDVTDYIDVVTNGVSRSVVVMAQSTDVVRLKRAALSADMTLTAERPYLIYDTLSVSPGVTLTIEPGARLLFHDKAAMVVHGILRSSGTAEAPVTMRGDRTGSVVADISFEVMSNQWEGIRFAKGSAGNEMSHTDIANTCQGLRLDSLADLSMTNCRVTNSGTVLITADAATMTAAGCELSNAADAIILLSGGKYRLDRCTLANWYLFSFPSMAIVQIQDPQTTELDITNSIIYGRGIPAGFGPMDDGEEITSLPIYFRRCMFRYGGEDDENFIGCIWDTDPMLQYSLTEYTFPYTPLPDSPAIDAADPALDLPQLPAADMRGNPRGATLGAYGATDESEN
mgnify:FL=1|jgi:hypothetical protein